MAESLICPWFKIRVFLLLGELPAKGKELHLPWLRLNET
jgi:hypothetical protein